MGGKDLFLLMFLVPVSLILAWSSGMAAEGKPRRILLDTDVDTDDIFALLYLLKQNRSQFELEVWFSKSTRESVRRSLFVLFFLRGNWKVYMVGALVVSGCYDQCKCLDRCWSRCESRLRYSLHDEPRRHSGRSWRRRRNPWRRHHPSWCRRLPSSNWAGIERRPPTCRTVAA